MSPRTPVSPAQRLHSRRSALRIAGSAVGAAILGGCGSDSGVPTQLAFADHAGARLSAILRPSFISASNDLLTAQSREWSSLSNASVDTRLTDDWREAYARAAERRHGADLADMFGSSVHLHAPVLADVSELAEELAAESQWISAARDAAVVDGVWRAIPWQYTAHAVNCRSDFLADVGVGSPSTFDELLEAATLLHDNALPLVGFSMNETAPNDSANFAYSMLWSFGAQEISTAGRRVVLNSEATRAALRYFRDLSRVSHPDAMTFNEAQNNQAFLNSEISMTQNASSIYWKALQEAPEVAEAMTLLKYPTGPAGQHQLLELSSIAIFAHSRNFDAAVDWIRYLMRPEQLRPRAQTALSFLTPTLLQYADDPDMPWNTDPKLAGVRGSHTGGHMPGWPGPASVEASLVYRNGSIVKMFHAVGTDAMSIEEAVTTATHDLERVYET